MDEEAAIGTDSADISSRSNDDRRSAHGWINVRHLGFFGRRRGQRRTDEDDNHYVDWYAPRLLYVTIATAILSFLDAALTLNLLSLGAIEINTLMAHLINTDVQKFVNIKVALTLLTLVFLVIHSNFRLFRFVKVNLIIYVLFFGYLTLILYEIGLLIRILML
ncbi:MAG: hypothetical protein HKN59_06575 [Gammaproteobacteria bacterium]|nr:hypothetical protein [Gammaproteobacteria bacterium]